MHDRTTADGVVFPLGGYKSTLIIKNVFLMKYLLCFRCWRFYRLVFYREVKYFLICFVLPLWTMMILCMIL
jgi:hypothetical protein